MNVLEEYKKYKKDLLDATQGILETAVADLMRKNVVESAQVNVYDKYEPTQYQRRGDDGGVLDEDCYRTSTEQGYDEVTLRLDALNYGNRRYSSWGEEPAPDGWDPGKITNIIESGRGYHWTGSKIYQMQPFPRPFLEFALHRTTAEAEPILIKALKNAGF